MVKLCILFIKFYQKTLGLLLPDTCRFTPTCSNYTIEALTRFGFFKGSLMGVYRILRCNPFCKGGYDPVILPEKEEKYG
uniref:Putative membrane protein insertion efficiency factor n=1 Tax=candidate division WOR-3 bacterium TaxID=2052148 RepID=A0A7V1EH18_UNCW3